MRRYGIVVVARIVKAQSTAGGIATGLLKPNTTVAAKGPIVSGQVRVRRSHIVALSININRGCCGGRIIHDALISCLVGNELHGAALGVHLGKKEAKAEGPDDADEAELHGEEQESIRETKNNKQKQTEKP